MSLTKLFVGAALLTLSAGPLYADNTDTSDPAYSPSKFFASSQWTGSSNLSLPMASPGRYAGQGEECRNADTLDRRTYTPSAVFKAC